MKKILIAIVALCATLATTAQTSNDEAAQRALQVGHTMQQERVYLHFDNSAYYLGETIWFKAYVSYGTNDRPSTPSKVLYVELVAPEGYIVETKKYKIDDNGCCTGEFELKPLMLSGYYEIRAYTRYMLNWGKEAVFSRVFPIFDKVNGNNWDFKNMLDRKRGFNYHGQWISAEETTAELKFYPEGGHLVAGLQSTVAYELKDCNGEPHKATITIMAGDSRLLTTTPIHYGKGTFVLTPQKGVKYSATVTLENKKGKEEKHTFELPEIEEEGVTLAVQESEEEITFSVASNISESEENAFGILYRGAIGYYKKIAAGEKNKQFTIKKNELPEGVNKAIVFCGTTPLAERCFFVEHDTLQKNDRSTVKLTVKGNDEPLNQLSLAPHEKITLNISRDDGQPIPSTANLSLAVSDAAGNVVTSWGHNMYSYLLLGSELKGYIPDAAQYFDADNKERKEQLNLLMLTNGWTAYDWKQLTSKKLDKLQPIERGITLKGSFFRKNQSTFKLGKGKEVTLIPQKNNLTRFDIAYDSTAISTTSFRTDSVGEFIIETNDFYGKRIAALSPETTLKENNNIQYAFALDRYFSPTFRLYHYWERNTGSSIEQEAAADSLVQLNPFSFLLSSVEVVSNKKKEYKGRPPHSEMRFDFLDEWEYAQDVTFLKEFSTYKDNVYNEVLEMNERQREEKQNIQELNSTDEVGFDYQSGESGIINMGNILEGNQKKYIGHMRYAPLGDTITKSSPNYGASSEYANSLTAADIVTSAIRRHNYNWAYWVFLMVVKGEYSSNTTPAPDYQYLEGKCDAEKMMNFKEFVIRSDEKTRLQFENTHNFWTRKADKLDMLSPLQKFYMGFLSHHYVSNTPGVDGFPQLHNFFTEITAGIEIGICYPKNPNYVACLIPYNENDERTGIIPDLANSVGTTRYTSIQGYSQSKQFYSPDYSKSKPSADKKDHRRTLLWQPQLRPNGDGSIDIELYNSSGCDAINVDIAGRDGQTFYSTLPTTITRINSVATATKAAQAAAAGSEDNDELYINKKMDAALEKACAREHEKALIYYNQKRYKNAITIWAELAKYKYTPALTSIAQCYKNGTGLKRNPEQTKVFFEEAAKAGCRESQYELYLLYKSGEGCTPDTTLAATWLRRATLQKEPRAMVTTARNELATSSNEGKERAGQLLAEAANSGNAEALYELARLIEEHPAMQSGEQDTTHYMRSAAEKGHREAQKHMMLHEEQAQNYTEAYRWAKELSMAGFHEGTKRMADYYYNGQGVKRNKKLAKDLYGNAAAAGNKEAEEILKNM